MTPWQRRLRGAIAVFGLGFAILVYVAVREPRAPVKPREAVERLDPTAAVEGTAGQLLRFRGERQDVAIEYDHSLNYADGRQKLIGVRVRITKRQGGDIRITADGAQVADPEQSHVHLAGHVVMTGSDGLRIEAPDAIYNKAEGTIRATGPVSFVRGRVSGTSVDATYTEPQDLLELHREAVLRFAGEQATDPVMDVTAGSAVFPRIEHHIRFEGGFRLVHGARVLESGAATAFLTDDESRVVLLEMRGQARISGLGEGAGAVKAMTAQDMSLEFAEDGRTLARATLSREAVIEVAADAGASRRISGGAINVGLAPDGTTVTSLTARDAVRLLLPEEGPVPARTITAANLVAAGEPGAGLTSASFSGDVLFREQQSAAGGRAAVTRTARSRTLDLAVSPGFGSLDDARFGGAVRFEEGQVRASGASVRYQVQTGVLDIDGIDESTGLGPRVADEMVTIDAQTIQLTLEGQKIVARTGVRSTIRPMQGRAAQDAGTRPAILKADQPIFATGETLNYDGASRLAVYAGGARLWQGDTAIQGDTVTLDDATGNLSAIGHARSTFMLDQRNEQTKQMERVASIGTADDFLYEEAVRRATYTTGARVSGPQGDLRAATIELYLRPSGRELDRAEAYEAVSLHVGDRDATGNRLTYLAADGKYLMLGVPVRIVAECRETEGRALTFWKSVDTISVDGDDDVRTQTKGGPACWGPRK
jgi:lipopolysaccharide export system protein LptA